MSTLIYREGATESIRRFNLCPNPRFLGQDGLVGWDSTPLQFDTTSGAPDGGGYTEITLTGDQTVNAFAGNDLFQSAYVVEGQTYSASAYIRAPRAGGVDIRLAFADAAGTQLDRTIINYTVTPNTWTRLVVADVVAPAGTEGFRITLTFQGSLGLLAGDVCGIAQRMIEQEVFVSPYFDGDYPVDGNRYYEWLGEPHASESFEWEVASAVVPDLVLNYVQQRDTGVTVHRTVSFENVVVTRREGFRRLPSGTFEFFAATQELAIEIADMCDGSTNVVMESSDVPNTPLTFTPTGQLTIAWNAPYSSWTVSVPYVGLVP